MVRVIPTTNPLAHWKILAHLTIQFIVSHAITIVTIPILYLVQPIQKTMLMLLVHLLAVPTKLLPFLLTAITTHGLLLWRILITILPLLVHLVLNLQILLSVPLTGPCLLVVLLPKISALYPQVMAGLVLISMMLRTLATL